MKPLRKIWSSGGGASVMVGAAMCLALLANGITREIPLGSAEGMVTMQENGRPLPGATVIFRPKFEQEGQPKSRIFEVGDDGRFNLRNIPAGEYSVEANSRAHSMEETRIFIAEGKPTALQLELEPSEPYLELSASQHVYTDDEKASFILSGFVNEDVATVDIFKATEQHVVKSGGIYNAFQSFSSWNNPVNPETLLGKPVRTFTHSVANERDVEGVFRDYINLESLPNGVYWVNCKIGGKARGTYLNITDLSLITKNVGNEVLCFASDIKTGKPVAGATIGFAKNGALSSKGTTNRDGILRFADSGTTSHEALVAAKSGDSTAFVTFYRPDERPANGIKIFTYTDRPVYRPGDEVQFKGIVRKLVGNGFAMAGQTEAEVRVLDYEDALLSRQTLSINEMGSFSGSFTFNRESPPGNYRLVVRCGGAEQTHNVEIAAYRKPEFTVNVKPAKPYFVRGDRGRATVQCEYYFGGPVVGAKVTVSVSRIPYWSYGFSDDEEYYAESGGAGGEYVQDIEAVTDGKGQAVIDFETMLEGDPTNAATDYLYTLTAYVEEGDKYFDGSGTVKVTRGEFGLGVEPDQWVLSDGESTQVTVSAISHQGEKPISGRQVRVVTGEYHYDGNKSEFIPLGTQTVTTGADGKATVNITPSKGGSITVKASAEDDRGNLIEAETYVYVDGYGGGGGQPLPKMSLTLDKKQYKIGERAKVLIQTDKPGGSAVVSVEGEELYQSRVVALDKGSTLVEIPVTADNAPNAFVTVAYVMDKRYSEASAPLNVSIGTRKLGVSIQADKPTYRPGETAIYTIKTVDADGNPVPAEVSLGIVDESIYAIREDRTNIVEGFYPMRHNAVQTAYSFSELYLDGGDKTPADIQVRSKFLDTAFWEPSVMTDASGVAMIQVTLPDNLTSWRATAIAASADTAVGQATMNVRARKDLMIRLQSPTFMVQGDTQVLTATINNDTGREAEVNYELQVDGVTVEGDLRDSVDVQAGEPATIEWTIRAARTGAATFIAKAWIQNGDSDGVRHTVSVQPHGRLVVDQRAGEIKGTETIKLAIRPGADPNTGRLLITLSPSLASSLVQALDGLIDFPYGCVEQTMSRFMPAVLVSQTIKNMGLPETPKSDLIPQIAREGYQRLRNMRGSGGGWGWFENDASDPYMTAYVLEGIYRATRAGYGDQSINVGAATEWIKNSLKSADAKKWSRANRLYLIYALTLHGEGEAARHFYAQENLSQAEASELAFACLIDKNLGVGPAGHLKALLGKASIGAATAHWTEDWYGFETTARALVAIMAVNPDHPVVPKIVRYLMQQRRGDMWVSTRDSSVSLIGLSEYLKHAQPGFAPSELTVLLNGQEVRRVRFDKASLFNPDLEIELRISNMKAGADNTLEFRSSAGTCFYAVDLRQTVVQQNLGQVLSGRGLTIQRRYYGLAPKRLEDGTMRLMQTGEAIDEIESGEPVRVVLTISASEDQEYIMIEDPIPSNCRVMERGAATYDDTWDWWYSQFTVQDDKVTYFARSLPAGTHTIEYTLRAESGGVARALPVVLSNMYDPAIRASSAESRLEVIRP